MPQSLETPPQQPLAVRVLRMLGVLVLCAYAFVLGLKLIQKGAAALPVLDWMGGAGSVGVMAALGTGWILAFVFLSGSPAAAVSLAYYNSGSLSDAAAFAMISGSRLGASFVVLVVGFIYDVRSRRRSGGTYVGALALLTTAVVYIPSFFLGQGILSSHLLDGIHPSGGGRLQSVIDAVVQPAVDALATHCPVWSLSVLGIALVVAAFKLFDGFLPVVDPTGGNLSRMATTIYRPWFTFLFGMAVTTITLSVSVSLTLLVPLTVKGLVRRENLIPYIMGANITTFVDTLVFTLLLERPGGFTVVLCQIVSVTLLSLPAVLLIYRPLERLIDSVARRVTRDRLQLTLFVLVLFAIPLGLIFLGKG